MRPMLIDLTDWRPFGVPLDSPLVKVSLALALVGLGLWLAGVLSRRRAVRTGRWPSLAEWALVAALAASAAALMVVVGQVHSYGLMMALGFLAAIALARWRTRRAGENPEVINALGIIALVGGVVGARLSYVFEHWSDPLSPMSHGSLGERLTEVARLSSGGLVFDGGLILALLAVLVYLRLRKLPVRRFLDILAISCMVGLAFGRMGCLLNGCCFGGTCDVDYPLAVEFPYAARPLVHAHGEGYPPASHVSPVFSHQFHQGQLEPEQLPGALVETDGGRARLRPPSELSTPAELAAGRHAHSRPVHPAQAYGIVNALVLAGLLTGLYRLRTREGQVFAMTFVLYPITRFVLEYIRDDNPGMVLTPAQIKCIVLLAFGVAMLVALRWLPRSAGPDWQQRQAELAKVEADNAPSRKRRPTSRAR